MADDAFLVDHQRPWGSPGQVRSHQLGLVLAAAALGKGHRQLILRLDLLEIREGVDRLVCPVFKHRLEISFMRLVLY